MRSTIPPATRRFAPLGLCLVLSLVGATAGGAAERRIIAPPGTDLGLPFSPGVASGDLLYLAGAIGNRPGSLELAAGVEGQVRQTLDNLKQVLTAADADLSHVVSATVFLSDSRHYEAMNRVYSTYFPNQPPARATVEADIAIPGALTEISMVAVRPGVKRRVIAPSDLPTPARPYSWGIQAGPTLFIAGVTGRDPQTGQPLAGGIETQTRQVLDTIGRVLSAAEMGFEDVVSCNVYLADARDFQAMNRVYREFFPQPPPARATVRTRLMHPDLLIEIQCTAVEAADRRRVVAPAAQASAGRLPFSPAIQVGERLYLSGFVGRGSGGYAAGDVREQTRQTLENLAATLAAAGMDFSNVVNASVFLSDVRFYDAMNEVYRSILPTPPPARATVGTQLASPEALVEIMMVASQ